MRRICFFLAFAVTLCAQAPTSWTPEFSFQFKAVGAVTPSPDGTRVIWTQTESIMDNERSETLTHIFLSNADGSHRVQLTRGDKSCTAPSFSADDRYIYFQSARSGKMNVFRIPIAGCE